MRAWDLASTKPRPENRDPDWTAGLLLGEADGEWYIADVVRLRDRPPATLKRMIAVHDADDTLLARHIPIRAEQEGGSAGGWAIDALRRGPFLGLDFDGVKPTVSKTDRARPVAIAAERGYVHIVDGPWVDDFLDEVEAFPTPPTSGHDDQVDALSLAWFCLTVGGLGTAARPQSEDNDDGNVLDALGGPVRPIIPNDQDPWGAV